MSLYQLTGPTDVGVQTALNPLPENLLAVASQKFLDLLVVDCVISDFTLCANQS